MRKRYPSDGKVWKIFNDFQQIKEKGECYGAGSWYIISVFLDRYGGNLCWQLICAAFKIVRYDSLTFSNNRYLQMYIPDREEERKRLERQGRYLGEGWSQQDDSG